MLKRSAVWLVMVVALSSCATVPAKSPETEAMIVEANTGLDALHEEFRKIYSDLGDVLERITLMMAHPGWHEMEQIIRASTATGTERNESPPGFDTEAALERWSGKWNASGEELYTRYLSLVEQCAFLEVRRIALRMRLRSVEIKLVHAMSLETGTGKMKRESSVEKDIDDVERLEKEINVYELNDLGLYAPGVSTNGTEAIQSDRRI